MIHHFAPSLLVTEQNLLFHFIERTGRLPLGIIHVDDSVALVRQILRPGLIRLKHLRSTNDVLRNRIRGVLLFQQVPLCLRARRDLISTESFGLIACSVQTLRVWSYGLVHAASDDRNFATRSWANPVGLDAVKLRVL